MYDASGRGQGGHGVAETPFLLGAMVRIQARDLTFEWYLTAYRS